MKSCYSKLNTSKVICLDYKYSKLGEQYNLSLNHPFAKNDKMETAAAFVGSTDNKTAKRQLQISVGLRTPLTQGFN